MSKVSAKVISKNAKEIRAKSNSIVEYWGARNIRSVLVGYGLYWVPASYRISDSPGDSGGTVVILTPIKNSFPVELIKDYILIWALPEKQEPAPASLSVTVTPGGSDYDTGSLDVAGVGGENKKKLKKEVDQLWEDLADLTAQLADVAVADPVLGEEQGEALEASLQEMIKSEGGLSVEDLAKEIDDFEVKDVTYEEAVSGFTTITTVFPLRKALLAQRNTRNGEPPNTLYIDFEREALRNIGLSHDNNIKAEASYPIDQFGMVTDLGASFMEMRREFVHQFEKIIDVDLDPKVPVAYTDEPVEYLVSVIDNKGRSWLERCKVMKLLTTRTISSKGHVYGFRLVVDSQQRINSQRQIKDSPLYSQQRSGLGLGYFGVFGNKKGKIELPGCSVLLERIELNKPDGEW